jgi:hypothetical protein
MKTKNGKFFTINGAHVFIKDGQPVEEALKSHKNTNSNTFSARSGTFIPGKGEPYKPNKEKKVNLSKQEWAMWYSAIGEIKRGMWCPESEAGYLIKINNKVMLTAGTYSSPKLLSCTVFDSEEEADEFIERLMKW